MWESKCVKTEKKQRGTGGALGARVLRRSREELWEGSWKIRFKISKMANIPNWQTNCNPSVPPLLFLLFVSLPSHLPTEQGDPYPVLAFFSVT